MHPQLKQFYFATGLPPVLLIKEVQGDPRILKARTTYFDEAEQGETESIIITCWDKEIDSIAEQYGAIYSEAGKLSNELVHTPGPLKVKRHEDSKPHARKGNVYEIWANEHQQIATVHNWAPEANAILFAAAPDLLKALQRLVHPAADDSDLEFAKEVIKKATTR